jgi:hypothetical protein
MFNSVRFLTGKCIANEAKKSPAAKKTPEAKNAGAGMGFKITAALLAAAGACRLDTSS